MGEGAEQHHRRRMELKRGRSVVGMVKNSLYEPISTMERYFHSFVTPVKVHSNRNYKVSLSTMTTIEKQSGLYGCKVDECVGNI